MMGYAPAREPGELGRADVETLVQLEGVTIDDFAVEFFGDAKRELALSSPGRTHDGHSRGVC
jgi:hypothetical protein